MSYPLRIAFVTIAGPLCAWCLFTFLARIAHPYLLGHDEGKKVAALRAELSRIDSDNEALKQKVAYLRSPEGAESEARRSGYHRPGETVYLIDSAELDAKRPAAATH